MPPKNRIVIEPADERKRRQAIDRFRSLLDSKTKECDWQNFFDEYPFIFSDTLSVKFDGLYRQLSLASGRPDYVFCQKTEIPHMGDYGVIELKRPTDSIIGSYSSKFIVESKPLKVALKQASSHLETLAVGNILKPDEFFVAGNRRYAFIIIGSSTEITKKCHSEFLQMKFRTLLPPGFQLFTYDELLRLLSSTVPPIVQVLFASHADLESTEITRRLRVLWENGIHGRPSSTIVAVSHRFTSEISITYGGMTVNAKSLMGMLTLAAGPGVEVVVTAKGRDATTAIATLDELFSREFFMPESYDKYRTCWNSFLVDLGIVSQTQLAAEKEEIRAKEKAAQKASQRAEMIRVAAYYQAKNDGFRLDSHEYWRRGEAEVDERHRKKPDENR